MTEQESNSISSNVSDSAQHSASAPIADNTPVIIGVASVQEKDSDPLQCSEAWQLMARAIEQAAADATTNHQQLIADIESISVPQGMWQYKNPAGLIKQQLGAKRAETVYATIGIPQLSLLSHACQQIIDGKKELCVVTGGEAKYRSLMAQINGVELQDTDDSDASPDFSLVSEDQLWSELEAERGLLMPTEFYAIMESSLRASENLGVEQHRQKISELYHQFSQIASENPNAWYQNIFSVEEIKNAEGKNAMLAFPYTKKHNTQWNVNQASAIIFCSAKKARELGVDQNSWVYPLASTQSCHAIAVSQRETLHSHPGTKLAAETLWRLSGKSVSDVDYVELYSCFPIAVQSFARDIGLDQQKPLTVTGGMPFAGGPLNNFTLQGLVRLTEVIRRDSLDSSATPSSQGDQHIRQALTGLISNISGMNTKQSLTLLSNQPPAAWQFADVSDQVAQQSGELPADAAFTGQAVIKGYTVVYQKDTPVHAIAVCETAEAKRTVARSTDVDVMQQMVESEFCGTTVAINEQGVFTL